MEVETCPKHHLAGNNLSSNNLGLLGYNLLLFLWQPQEEDNIPCSPARQVDKERKGNDSRAGQEDGPQDRSHLC